MAKTTTTTDVMAAARAALKKHKTYRAAAAALGMPLTTFQGRLHGMKPKSVTKPKLQNTLHNARGGHSLQEFRAAHDKNYIVPRKIQDGLRMLGKAWRYEMAFAKLSGVSLTDLAVFREQFAEYIVVLDRSGKRAWAGDKAFAQEMREMI